MNTKHDLIVLGTGGAGYQVASRCAAAGWSVAAIDRGPFGGTCAVRGCIPKKVLSGTAEIADINRRLHKLGLIKSQPEFSWSQLIKFKNSFTETVSENTKQSLRDAGVEVLEGSPKFVDEHTVEVNGQRLQAKKIHIAVGMEPAKLPISGFEHLMDSDGFLDIKELPKRIIFVGGGYISFEFAHVASRFGAEVTILHSNDRPLPMFDKDIIDELLAASKTAGINVVLSSSVEKIENDAGFTVFSSGGNLYKADLVVHGAGRVPSISTMNLEAAGIKYDKRRGIKVNNFLQTSNPDIYAAGDAADSGPPLTPVSGNQGSIAADNLLGGSSKLPDYLSTVSVIFSTPTVAKTGLTPEEATKKDLNFETYTNDLTGWFDSKRIGLEHAKSKVLAEKNTGRIIGAHLIGNRVEDLISIFSLAVEHGLTAAELKKPLFAFPSSSDDIRSMF